MKCRASIGYLETDTPVLFQPDVLQEWPEELQINEQLMMLKKGTSSKVTVCCEHLWTQCGSSW